ncbi:MAG: hypothetical protein ACE5IH_04700 [Thermodesulfobacteriota bacterium]
MSNPLIDKIEDVLNAAVGSVFAKASVEVACRSAGVKADDITRTDLPVIAEKLKDGLSLLFGVAVAESVELKVKGL